MIKQPWFLRHNAAEVGKGCWNPAFSLWRAYELERLTRPFWREAALDLGCGDGTFGRLALPQARLVGLDIGLDLRSALAEQGYESVVQADASQMPFEDASFALVISNCAMEHMERLDLVLGEIERVLRPGGELAFTVPSKRYGSALWGRRILDGIGLPAFAQRYAARKNENAQHLNLLDPDEWASALAAHGLELIEADPILPGIALGVWELLNPVFGRSRPMVRRLSDMGCIGNVFRKCAELFSNATFGAIYRFARIPGGEANLYILAGKVAPRKAG